MDPERCIESILLWLEASDFGRFWCKRRLNARALADVDFVARCIEGLCPNFFSKHLPKEDGKDSGAVEAAVATVDALFWEQRQVQVQCKELVRRAEVAGNNDLEPLEDILNLWRYLLVCAVVCESKEEQMQLMLTLPQSNQADIMSCIQAVESKFAANPSPRADSEFPTPTSEPRHLRNSLFGGGEVSSTYSAVASAAAGGGFDRQVGTTAGASTTTPHRGTASVAYTPSCFATPTTTIRGEGQSRAMEDLIQQNEMLRNQVEQLSDRLERDRQTRQRSNVLLDGELEAFERSWNLEKLLEQKNDEIKHLTEKVCADMQAADEHQEVLAEVQALRAQEEEHALVRARLERATARLEEVGHLRSDLQAARQLFTEVSSERDEMRLELSHLRQLAQQLDAWKSKAHSLELRSQEAEAKQRSSEVRATAAENEKSRILSEKSILDDQLREANLQITFLKERGPSLEGEEIIEPLTAETREHIQWLEARNSTLEKQLTSEGAEKVAQLTVEVESLKDVKQHLERQMEELRTELSTREALCEEQKRQLQTFQEESARQAKRMLLLEEDVSKLEDERDDARDLLDGQKDLLQALKDGNTRLKRLQEQATKDMASLRSQVRDLEQKKLQADDMSRRFLELQKKVEGAQTELSGAAQARLRAELRQRDDLWSQRQGALEEGLEELRKGLEQQVSHNKALKTQLEASERRVGHFREALRSADVGLLEATERRALASLQPPVLQPGLELELARAKNEVRRLQSELASTRLRGAEESQQLAHASAQLRRLQRCNDDTRISAPTASSAVPSGVEAGALRSTSGPRVAFVEDPPSDGEEQHEEAVGAGEKRPGSPARGNLATHDDDDDDKKRSGSQSGSPPPHRAWSGTASLLTRVALQERPVQQACSSENVASDAGATSKRRPQQPRSSILKRPKDLDLLAPQQPSQDQEEPRKENMGSARFATLPYASSKANRPGRIGLLA